MEVRTLLTRFGADSTGFVKGAAEVAGQLTSLNKKFFDNKAVMKEVQKEINNLYKEQKKLDEVIKSGKATAEQTSQYEKNRAKIDELVLKKAQLKTVEQTLTAEINKTKDALKQQNTQFDTAADKVKSLSSALKLAVTGYTGKKLFDALIGSNAEMEQYQTSFEIMLGSVSKAKKMMEDLTTFASKTPFTLEDTIPQASLLMSYGVQSGDLINTMTKLGDLAQGNADKFSRISLAYGQMLAKGKVTGEELRQMTEAGVPLMQTLADVLGVTTEQYAELQEKGEVSIATLNQGIDKLTTGTGKFAGMMEKQSQTMQGMLSTVKDNLQQIGRDIGTEAFAEIKSAIEDIMATIKKAQEDGTLSEKAKEIGESIGKTIKKLWELKEVIAAGVSAFVAFKISLSITSTIAKLAMAFSSLKTATQAATTSQIAFNTALNANPIALIASAVISLISAFSTYSALKTNINHQEYISTERLEEETTSLSDMIAKYEELRGKTENTWEEKVQLSEIQNELIDSYGVEADKIDLVNGKYDEQLEKLKNLSKARLEELHNQQIINTNTALSQFNNKTPDVLGQNITGGPEISKDLFEGIANTTFTGKGGTKQGEYFLEFGFKGDTLQKYNAVTEVLNRMKTSGLENIQLFSDLVKKQTEYRDICEKTTATLNAEVTTAEKQGISDERTIRNKTLLSAIQSRFGSSTKEANEETKKEKVTLDELNKILESNRVVTENAEASKTVKVALETAERLKMYGKEVASIKSVADANLVLMKMEEERWRAAIAINSYYDSVEYDKKYGKGTDFSKLKSQVGQIKSIMATIEKATAATSASATKTLAENATKTLAENAKKEISVLELATAAYKKLADERIAAIDKEIAARQKLQATQDTQKEIDRINYELKNANVSQLDEFSRMELIKKRDNLIKQQQDTEWLNAMNEKKAKLQEASDYAATIFANAVGGTPTATSIVNNNTSQSNINLIAQAATAGQIAQAIYDKLMKGLAI